jgi:hypothetical protein
VEKGERMKSEHGAVEKVSSATLHTATHIHFTTHECIGKIYISENEMRSI